MHEFAELVCMVSKNKNLKQRCLQPFWKKIKTHGKNKLCAATQKINTKYFLSPLVVVQSFWTSWVHALQCMFEQQPKCRCPRFSHAGDKRWTASQLPHLAPLVYRCLHERRKQREQLFFTYVSELFAEASSTEEPAWEPWPAATWSSPLSVRNRLCHRAGYLHITPSWPPPLCPFSLPFWIWNLKQSNIQTKVTDVV